MATKCGVSGSDFLKDNPAKGFCSKLKPGQHVCCSSDTVQQKRNLLSFRGECETEKVQQDDSCAAIATRCAISGADFCSKLKPGQHVCCSSGTLPNFSPKPNKDGSCATTTVGDGESCSTIAAANSLTEKDIDGFNQKTWGWTGCKNIFKDSLLHKPTDPVWGVKIQNYGLR
ncbi:hypothetical protein N7449_005160 [Penicillium cf. viridicatum]|uniref:LysM domain-containing protein n=1 Tax=Penicillium cf. viridicatum TaxID=2972119 RepID=A0A9W9MKJ8_9EURO|nr:hypothetical protein N7449_005160 [Penicillium cf. viridicatum]